jgi:hypothetical protein
MNASFLLIDDDEANIPTSKEFEVSPARKALRSAATQQL